MSFLSAIRVALATLLVHKARSMLTSLGIVIGISAVIAMVSAGSGARYILDSRLNTIGRNLILIRAGGRTSMGIVADSAPITREDVAAIRKQTKQLLVGVAEFQLTQRLVSTRTSNHGTTLSGSVPDMQPVRNWKVLYGRFFTDEDMKKSAPVCLIGQTVRRKLFPDKSNPVGETLYVDRLRLQIIGVTAEKGRSPTGADQDDQIFLPITTLLHKLVGEEKISVVVASAKNEETVEKAKAEIVKILRERHHLKPGESDDFSVDTVREMSELAEIVTITMHVLIAVIASISLVVAGIGIMNIMLVSVTERTREIGIRMAVGATSFDVLIQFLIEAVVLSLVGGVIGISLGIGGAVVLAYFADWPVVIEPGIVILAFLVAAGVGIFFGYYPALKASRLDPIEALRYE